MVRGWNLCLPLRWELQSENWHQHLNSRNWKGKMERAAFMWIVKYSFMGCAWENRSLESRRFLHLSLIALEGRAEWGEMSWGQ